MSERSMGRKSCIQNEKDCFKCNTTSCNYLQSFQINNPIETIMVKLNSTDDAQIPKTNSTGNSTNDNNSGNFVFMNTFTLALTAIPIQLFKILIM